MVENGNALEPNFVPLMNHNELILKKYLHDQPDVYTRILLGIISYNRNFICS